MNKTIRKSAQNKPIKTPRITLDDAKKSIKTATDKKNRGAQIRNHSNTKTEI